MLPRALVPTLSLFLTTVAVAGDVAVMARPETATPVTTSDAGAATQPAKLFDGYRHLDPGSWVVTEARVRSNGTPTAIRRKVMVTTDAAGRRVLEDHRWHNEAFEPTGPAQPLAPPDRRAFDELGLRPQSTLPDQPLTVGRKRYLCSVATYVIKGGDRSTTLTLYRDKSKSTQLPPRSIAVNGKDLPLPADCLQADVVVEGATVSTRGQRRIVSLASPIRVNGQACNCLVESTRTEGTSNGKPMTLTVQEWFCHDLPGERLRTVTQMTVGSMEAASDVAVLDFHVARPDATIHTHTPAPPAPTSPPSAE
jgi:hypothetical protein